MLQSVRQEGVRFAGFRAGRPEFLHPLCGTLAYRIGVPMYTIAAGIIPVVEALMGKGAALGTVLAFMMSSRRRR